MSESSAPRVLFVAHEATRTGAPIMLWHFLRWARDHTPLDFEVLLLGEGPLAPDFAAVGPTHVVKARGQASMSYIEAGIGRAGFNRAADRLKIARLQRATRHLRGFDALYLNSSTSALALRFLPEIPPVVFSHVHELNSAFSYWFPDRDRAAMLEHTDWFVTCADAVSRHLVTAHGVASDQIRCHYEFIVPPMPSADGAESIREQLGIPRDAFVVGSVGQVIWRKGPDLFLQVADHLVRHRPDLDVHFVWVGGVDPLDTTPVQRDVTELGLADRVHFVGEVSSPAEFFASLDVFCLTSREDPFPLVMLEAAALGVPIVSFVNGGSVEFARHDGDGERCAIIVPYLDVPAMADAVVELATDPLARKLLGDRGRDRVLTDHTVEVAAAALYEDLRERIATPTPPGARSTATKAHA